MLCQSLMHQGKGWSRGRTGPLVAKGSRQRAAAFCPGLGGSEEVCVSLHPGDGDTAKQEHRGRRVHVATWEAVNRGLTTTTQIRWEMPQNVTFLPVVQSELWAVPAWMDCGSSQGDSLPQSPSLFPTCGGRLTTRESIGTCYHPFQIPFRTNELLITPYSTFFREEW